MARLVEMAQLERHLRSALAVSENDAVERQDLLAGVE
jgi:hypothetical protein